MQTTQHTFLNHQLFAITQQVRPIRGFHWSSSIVSVRICGVTEGTYSRTKIQTSVIRGCVPDKTILNVHMAMIG